MLQFFQQIIKHTHVEIYFKNKLKEKKNLLFKGHCSLTQNNIRKKQKKEVQD